MAGETTNTGLNLGGLAGLLGAGGLVYSAYNNLGGI